MKGLKYISWYDHSGYAVAARRYLSALIGAGIRLTWTPMVPGGGWGREFYFQPFSRREIGDSLLDPVCNVPIEYHTVLVHLVPEYFPAWKANEPGKRLIGCTTWETDRLPEHWPDLMNIMDEIWVPSTWNRDVFLASGVTVPVHVVPYILREPPECQSLPISPLKSLMIPAEHQVFYSINVWTQRKGLRSLLETYWRTFTSEDPVTLVVKTSQLDMTHPFRDSSFPLNLLARTRRTTHRLARKYPDRPSTHFITEENVPQAVIDALHSRGDIYISLSHAEGWGMGSFDAVAAGNAVITTGYGGSLDFLDPEAAGLVDFQESAVKDSRNPNYDGPDHHWADPDPEHAAWWMRKLCQNPEDARLRGRKLRDSARSRFDEATILRRIMNLLEKR